MLVVYSNKVKESNHHTICIWIDYAQKKKKENLLSLTLFAIDAVSYRRRLLIAISH
jgi:hypothetical protein